MIRKPEQWSEIARLTFEDAVPCEVLPSHGPLSDQDRVLFRDWECAAAPRGVHKFMVSGMAIQMHEEAPVLAFTGQVCHRTADRELLLKDRLLRDCRISARVLPQDAECGPTTDRADCAEAQPLADRFGLPYPRRQCAFRGEIDIEDNLVVSLRLANGVKGSYTMCCFAPDAERNYAIMGTKGRLEINLHLNEIKLIERPHNQVFEDIDRHTSIIEIDPESLKGGHGGADPKIAKGFLDYLLRDVEPRATMLDGRMSVAAGCAATDSIREGGVRTVRDPG